MITLYLGFEAVTCFVDHRQEPGEHTGGSENQGNLHTEAYRGSLAGVSFGPAVEERIKEFVGYARII